MQKYCAILPTVASRLPKNVFSADDERINFADETLESVFTFTFDKIIDYTNTAKISDFQYEEHVNELASKAISGDSVLSIVLGSPCVDDSYYFTSDIASGREGILRRAASELLKSRATAGSVHFSWSKIDCQTGETVIDVLKLASCPTVVQPGKCKLI